LSAGASAAQPGTADEAGPRYYVYDDKPADYIPSGWMPDGRGLAQEVRCEDDPHAGKFFVRSQYRPQDNVWAGIGWELDGDWNPKRKLDLFAKLQAKPGDRIVLRFWARSKDRLSVKFIAGGGKGDSLGKAVTSQPEWGQLAPEWTRYEIDLTAQDLSGVVQAFACFLERDRNRGAGRGALQWDLDEIYFVRLAAPGAKVPGPPASFSANRQRFHRKLATLQWIDYSPSTFNPGARRPVSADDIEADLKALAAHGFPPQHSGICTYGCSPRSGGDKVPAIARKLGFSGVILGVWSIDKESDELPVARRLAADGMIDAVCMGNEGLFFSRYSSSRLLAAVQAMRAATALPVSTSEVIDSYGNRVLTNEKEMDWVYPNLHPVFRNYSDPKKAVQWMHDTLGKLAERSRLPILVHETGWPSRGLAHHTEEKQREFWELVLKSGNRFAVFEAFDQPWKHEKHQGVDIGTSWGWFTAERRPKGVVRVVAGPAVAPAKDTRK
jgi:exo-beta-1,3-glucanase (GH17 family)